jgi:Urocanase Rossmann-like domain
MPVTNPLTGTDLQRQTLRLYGELLARRESWARKLVFACGEGCSATGLSTAVSIAGGTSLIVDSDSAVVKSVMRQGGLDFVVNTLDEALRVLKNEVRQGRPLSVGLIADVSSSIREMAERGVLPDLHVAIANGESADYAGELESLRQSGMESVQLARDSHGCSVPSAVLAQWLLERGWFETLFVRSSEISSPVADGPLIDILPPADSLRRNWIQQISRYQRSAKGSRLVWLSGVEERSFADGNWCKSVP